MEYCAVCDGEIPEDDCKGSVNKLILNGGRHIHLKCRCGYTEDMTANQLVEELNAEIATLRKKLSLSEEERDKFRKELVEFYDWQTCEHCGKTMEKDEFISDVHGRLGIFNVDEQPIYCPECASKLGWFCKCKEENYRMNAEEICPNCGQKKEDNA